jgi:uncharacterized protein
LNQDIARPSLPWWRVPTVWLVIGGPALVVVASMAMLVLALRGADAVRDLRSQATPLAGTLAPATQARNHAATPRR